MTSVLLLCLALLLYTQSGEGKPHSSCQLHKPVTKDSLLKFKRCLEHYLDERTPNALKSILRDEKEPISTESKDIMTASYLMTSLLQNGRSSRALADNLVVPFVGRPFWNHKRSPGKEDIAKFRDARAAEPGDISEMLDAYKTWRQLHGYGNGGGRWGR